jgi:hypothetical protein
MSADATLNRRANRSQADWDKLALDTIVPMLQDGTSMTDIRAQFGAGPTIRRALTRVGYNTKGQKVGDTKTVGTKPAVLAKRVAERRRSGAAWWRLELETGKDADTLRSLLTEHGETDLTSGRVVVSERGKKRAAKAAAEAEAAAKLAAAKPARKRTPRAKVTK